MYLNMATQSAEGIPNNFSNEFILGKPLARGHFGQIHECTHKGTKRRFAAKHSLKGRGATKQLTELRNEIEILGLVKHTNIVEYIGSYETLNELFLVTELLEGGGLIDHLVESDFFTEMDAAIYTHQLMEALAFLHANSVVHQDIKPDNIAIASASDKLRIKLIDFGIAKQCPESGEYLSIQGTTVYSPPEVLCYEPTDSSRDMWSAGVFTYVMLSGQFPFDSEKESELMQQIVSGDIQFTEDFVDLSEHATEFITKLLKRERKSRLTADSALKHSWISVANCLPNRKINTNKLREFNAKLKWKSAYMALSVAVALERHKFTF